MDYKVKNFLGCGCSRIAWSLGDGTCLKTPIKERSEAGTLQNRLEYENFKLGEDENLTCFPKAKSHSEDWTEIVVEECKHLESDDDFLKAFGLTDTLERKLKTAIKFANCQTCARFVGFWILGWLEGMTIEKACSLVQKSEKAELSCSDLGKVLPFKTLDDILAFLKIVVDADVSMSVHAAMTRAILAESKFLCDILRFKLAHPNSLYIKDLWNIGQYGLAMDGRLVVIDAGYNHTIANSTHFAIGRIVKETKTSNGFDTFNGQRCTEIISQTGSPVEWKFFTSNGTEYVLSATNQARRIKQAGLNDDGLHPWMDRMVFVDEQDAVDAINTIVEIKKTLTPIKLDTSWKSGAKLDIQKLVQGRWRTQLSVTIQDTKPQIGKNALEFMLDGYIVKAAHAGHAVTKLKHFPV